MRIEIAQRLRPYTHVPGMASTMPGTGEKMVVYPAMINQEPLPIKGPVRGFTHQMDMEKGCIKVFGFSKEGYFRKTLPSGSSAPHLDSLSFGVDKAQDWELIRRRCDPAEYLPFWYRLGQMVPSAKAHGGTAKFLAEWRRRIEAEDREGVLEPVHNLFISGFDGILAPRLVDSDHHGFDLSSPEPEDNPLALLSQGASLIRQMLVSVADQTLQLLPVLPTQFHCGRLVGTSLGPLTLSMEWSKKLLRRFILSTETVGEWNLHFQKSLRSFRLRHSVQERGERLSCDTWLTLEPGVEYLFDCFEK